MNINATGGMQSCHPIALSAYAIKILRRGQLVSQLRMTSSVCHCFMRKEKRKNKKVL
jgi:hypothetical protein